MKRTSALLRYRFDQTISGFMNGSFGLYSDNLTSIGVCNAADHQYAFTR